MQRCIVHHVSRLPSSSFLTAYRLRSASIWAMRGSLYALGVVLIPLSHPDSSMYDATLFITFLGLSIMFVFGLAMLSQSLPPEMAHASPDARSLWMTRHVFTLSTLHPAMMCATLHCPSCLLCGVREVMSEPTASQGKCLFIWHQFMDETHCGLFFASCRSGDPK